MVNDMVLGRWIIEPQKTALNFKFNVSLDANFSSVRSAGCESGEELEQPSNKFSWWAVAVLPNLRMLCLRLGWVPPASPTRRLTEENVSAACKQLQEEIANNQAAKVVYQLFDSSVCSSAPGEQSLHRRGEDGQYHVRLVMADWPTFRKIYATAVSLLKGGRCCESEPI